MPKIALPRRSTSRITDFLASVGLKYFATDAEPEDIMEAVDAMAEEKGAAAAEEKPEVKTEVPAKDVDPANQALEAKVDKLTELVTQLLNAEKKEPSPDDAIDAAIAELQKPGEQPAGDDDEEESHTIPVEQMDNEEGPVSELGDRPKSALTGDNAYKIAALKAMKPILAAIPDPAQRKIAADAAIASIKGTPASNTYAKIKPKKPAKDSNAAPKDQSHLGREWAKKFNPHYKNRA